MADSNQIERLLDALPAAIAKEKRVLIQTELEEIGQWEHYRQNARKPGRLAKMNLITAVVFKKHLGVTDDFFIGTEEQQQKEIARIVRLHYDLFIKPQTAAA